MDPLVLNLVCEKMAESDLAIKPYMAVNGRLFTLYGIITESVSIKVHEWGIYKLWFDNKVLLKTSWNVASEGGVVKDFAKKRGLI